MSKKNTDYKNVFSPDFYKSDNSEFKYASSFIGNSSKT
jgi:hypothetical protein